MPARKRAMVGSLLSLAMAMVLGCGAPQTPASAPAGGEESPQYGGVLFNHPGNADPPSFDSQLENTVNTNRPITPAYNTLVQLSGEKFNEIAPDLAEKWEMSPDGKLITFTLRKGVKFHDGNDLTSTDVKFNVDRIRGVITQGPGALVSPRKDLVRAIERVDTPDPQTVVLRLQYPSASLLLYLASFFNPMYDKEWIEAGHDPKKEVNGTGPFKFKEYIRGVSVELVKNESYWDAGLPYLDGVKTYIIPDLGTVLAGVRTGQVAFMSLSQAQAETLRQEVEGGALKGKVNLVKVPSTSAGTAVWVNTNKKPFDDVRVRQALTMAVDRADVGKVQGGPEAVVKGWLPAGTFYALPPEELAKLPGYRSDKAAERAEARRLLAEAGYPDGLRLKGMTRNEQQYIDNGIVYSDQFKKVGIIIEPIEVLDISVIYQRYDARDFDISFSSGGSGTTEDPDTVFGQFHVCGSPRNYVGICDPRVEDLFSRQAQAMNPEERQRLSRELEKLVLNVVPGLPTASSSPAQWGISAQVRGIKPWGTNVYRLDRVWLAKQ